MLTSSLHGGAWRDGQVRPICVRWQVQSSARVRQAAHSKGRAHARPGGGAIFLVLVLVLILLVLFGIIVAASVVETDSQIER
jgi:hypothetical protein